MAYTKEKRAENAAKAAAAAEAAARAAASAAPPQAPDAEPQTRPAVTQARTRNDDRSRAFDEVVDRHHRETGLADPDTQSNAVQAVAETPSTEPATAPTTEPATPDTAPAAAGADTAPVPDAPKTVKQIVDGKEYDVPIAEIEEAGGERAWRRDRASQNRLDEAKAALAESRRAQAEAATFTQALLQRAEPQQPRLTDIQLINAIRAGDETEALAALKELENRAKGQHVDPQQIVMQATAISNYNAARRKFASVYSDVVKNPLLTKLALALEQDGIKAMAPNGPDWVKLSDVDFDGFFSTIGNQVRSVVPRPSQPQPAPAGPTASTPSPASSDREARKASTIVNLPTAAAQRAELPPEEKPESREETLAYLGQRTQGRRPQR